MLDTRKSGLIQSSPPSLSRTEMYVSQAGTEIKPTIRSRDHSKIDKYGNSQDVHEENAETVITDPRVVQNPTLPPGPLLVYNSDFGSADGWTLGTGWSVANGVASSDGSQAGDSDLTQVGADIAPPGLVENATYVVTFTLIPAESGAGNVTPVIGGTEGTDRLATGTAGVPEVFTEDIIAGAGVDIDMRADVTFNGSITGVIVRRKAGDVTVGDNVRLVADAHGMQQAAHPNHIVNGAFAADTDWTKGTSWTIAAGVATCGGAQLADSDLTQIGATLTNALVSGASYNVTFTVSGYVAGEVAVVLGDGTAGTARVADGTYTETIVAGAGADVDIRGDVDFEGNIDNISVHRVDGIVVDITQWQLDAGDLVGEVESILILDNIQIADAGAYTCDFTNASGTTSSAAQVITVIA